MNFLLFGFLEVSINPHTQYGAMHMDYSQLDRDVAAHTRDLHLTITALASASANFTPSTLTAYRHRKTCQHSNTKL